MPAWVEFHDSTLESASLGFDGVTLLFDAYVHRWERIDGRWVGTGWSQPVSISIGGPAVGRDMVGPVEVDEGCLTIDESTDGGLVPLPLLRRGQVTLRVGLCTGERLEFAGRGVRVESQGEATFVEELPEDMRPSSG